MQPDPSQDHSRQSRFDFMIYILVECASPEIKFSDLTTPTLRQNQRIPPMRIMLFFVCSFPTCSAQDPLGIGISSMVGGLNPDADAIRRAADARKDGCPTCGQLIDTSIFNDQSGMWKRLLRRTRSVIESLFRNVTFRKRVLSRGSSFRSKQH